MRTVRFPMCPCAPACAACTWYFVGCVLLSGCENLVFVHALFCVAGCFVRLLCVPFLLPNLCSCPRVRPSGAGS